MSIFAFCAFLPREFERNRTLSKKTIYRLRKFLGWCIIKLKIRLRIFLYTPVLCLWSSDHRNSGLHAASGAQPGARTGAERPVSQQSQTVRNAATALRAGQQRHLHDNYGTAGKRRIPKLVRISLACGLHKESAKRLLSLLAGRIYLPEQDRLGRTSRLRNASLGQKRQSQLQLQNILSKQENRGTGKKNMAPRIHFFIPSSLLR